MKLNKRLFILLTLVGVVGIFTLINQAAQPEKIFTVTVPLGISPTMHDETDAGSVRVELVGDGDDIYHYNFPSSYIIHTRTRPVIDPDIMVCNEEGSPITVQFYHCDDDDGSQGTVIVTLEDTECFNTDNYNCATQCVTANECPL